MVRIPHEMLVAACTLAVSLSSAGSAQTTLVRSSELPALTAFVDSVITQGMEEDRIPGAAFVLVANGRVAITKGYGLANIERQLNADPNRTIWRIGSISKAVTMMGLLQLVDRGAVRPDTDVNVYFDSPLVDRRFAPVTVNDLFTHSAGFDQIGLRRQVRSVEERESLASFLGRELVRVRPAGFVGTYDTYGATLAGYLIESVSHRPYAEHMRRSVFEPLGMTSTFVETPDSLRDRLAVGYGFQDGRYLPQRYEWYVTLPASSIDATANDMGRLMIALLGDGSVDGARLFSAEAAARLRHQQRPLAPGLAQFSYGFWETSLNGVRALEHGGVMAGFESEMYLLPDRETGFFLVYNRDRETGPAPRLRDDLASALADRWFRQPETKAVTPLPISTKHLEGAYAGTVACFTCPQGQGWSVNAQAVRSSGEGVVELWGRRWLAVDSLVFRVENGPSYLVFVRHPRGGVSHMVYENTSYARLDTLLFDDVFGAGWRSGPPPYLMALRYATMGEFSRAADTYEAIAEADSSDGRSRYYAGYYALQAGEAKRAIDRFADAIAIGQWVPQSTYYIAAAYAAMDDYETALDSLTRAAELGFAERAMIEEDRWWEPLRGDPRLETALNAAGTIFDRERERILGEPLSFDPVGVYVVTGGAGDRAFTLTLDVGHREAGLGGTLFVNLGDRGQFEEPVKDIVAGGHELLITSGPLVIQLRVDGLDVSGAVVSGPVLGELRGTKQ
jgi:CubicO group peptidase (beta-lactamase class C family)